MDNFQQILGDAAGGALCNLLSAYGASAPLLTAISLVEPTPFGEVAATTAGLAGLAAYYGCSWDPNAPGPGGQPAWSGCSEYDNGLGVMKSKLTNGSGDFTNFTFKKVLGYTVVSSDTEGESKYRFQYIGIDDKTRFHDSPDVPGTVNSFFTEPVESGGDCKEPAPPEPVPDPPPYTYTDPDSGCKLTVNFKGWGIGPSDTVDGIWEISPELPSGRAAGGVIGGCNFSPVIYSDGGGGGGGCGGGPTAVPVPDPIPPDDDEPWWADLIRAAAQGLTAAAVKALLDEYFAEIYPGGSYRLQGVCELDASGNPIDVTRSINFPGGKSTQAVLERLDALADMFQFAKELRQPVCEPPILPQTGEPVTITFRSDLPSPVSGDPIRKIFTYFDQSGRSQLDHTLHWENFSWEAGPVIVSVNNTNLGKPQVWAATEAEGVRVINHAAQIAGADMRDAEWIVTTPRSQRYGLSGTMRVYVDKASRIWVTKRDGPDGLPYVYKPT